MLNRILDSKEYPRDKHLFIMDMMRKFELCFDFEGFYDEKFLIPDLLSREEPYTGKWDDALAFQYHYDALPGSIISRFIVRMHPYICKETYWRSGVVLEDKDSGNKALVKADREDKKIFIRVSGREQTRRVFLGVIRSNFEYIHQTIPGIEPEEKVPLTDHPEIVVGYRRLLKMEKKGVKTHFPEELEGGGVPVKKLLDGVESEEERRERREESGRRDPTPRTPPPVRPVTPTDKQSKPWISGSFYLVAIVIIMAVIAAIIKYVSWYAVPVVIIGVMLFIAVIGAFQLRQEDKLSQENFLELMRDIFKQLPLIKK